MSVIVQKYGGTSVATIDKIKVIASRISARMAQGDKLVIVLSAMAGETDRLLDLAKNASHQPNPKYQDVLLSTGEQVSVSLLAMALEDLGIKAEPLVAHQIGIITDCAHSRAKIKSIDAKRIEKILDSGSVPVIAGFQGITEDGAITTIGRGGSDISAVAIAAAINAKCEIFTDVEGVFTADPKICGRARKLNQISYEEMLELSDAGAKVLHTRSVEIAAKYRVPIHVRSSFSPDEGTWLVPEEESMETRLVSGITCNINEAKIAIRRVPDKVGIPAKIFQPIAKALINVDMILQNVSAEGYTDLTFTVHKEDLKKAITLAENVAREIGAGKVEAAGDIAKISVVGLGMRSHAGIAHTMFDALAKEGIAIQMIGTSEIKVSIVIDIKYAELAVRILHDAFQL